mmetsp:Transcript_24489/g.36531  ORF Transcript_24489/g.36531 Transcript_24489/m.36531 type:complete len:136 (-) Transcript_24489:598-1005(-)
MRIVAANKAAQDSLKLFSKSPTGKSFNDDVTTAISEFTVGDQKERSMVENQRRQVERLMDQIHVNNPSMLPSIINPMPLKSKPLPQGYSRGKPAEAYLVLNDCNRCFVRTPGATAWLEKRFGKRPKYDVSIDYYH